MTLRKIALCLIAGGLTVLAQNAPQNAPRMVPVPADSREVAAGRIQVAKAPASREAALQLLTRARNSYLMRDAHQPWDLKVRLTVDSGGQTNHDGEWEMEDQFAPGQGLHWTAKSSTGYSISGIFAGKETYTEATTGWIPLRLQE